MTKSAKKTQPTPTKMLGRDALLALKGAPENLTKSGGSSNLGGNALVELIGQEFNVGVKLWYAVSGTYMQPVVPAEAADPPQSAAAGSPVENMADFFTSSSGSPIDLDGINTGPFTDGSPAEEIGDWLVLVMEVEPGASQGVLAAETLTLAFDEI